jgi:hypothetical protein
MDRQATHLVRGSLVTSNKARAAEASVVEKATMIAGDGDLKTDQSRSIPYPIARRGFS